MPKWDRRSNMTTPSPELITKPVIIGLICGFCVLAVVLAIITILMCCRKRDRMRDSAEAHRCYHCSAGHTRNPPPAYSPSDMHFRPPPYRCDCHPGEDMLRHQPLGIHNIQMQQTSRELQPNGRSLNEFPLLQYPPRDVINPVYDRDSEELDGYDIPHGPLRSLYKESERSFSQTVSSKLLVSVARRVDNRGDTLILDNMGISLEVPEGAIRRGQSQWITLVLNWDLSDNPQMTKDQSLVSPVVYVGPHGLKLDKPCVLSYRHCSFDARHIQVMRSETELTDMKSWETVCNRDDESKSYSLTQDECRLSVDKFTLYTCVQSPVDDRKGKKWLQIAVFACPLRREINHHQIRVYFLNKTPCALQWAIQNEAGFGGKLVCPEKVFLFDGGDYDMIAKTRYVSDGWDLVDMENSDKISFLKIWHGQCPHISVCYKRRPLNQGQNQTLYQQTRSSNTVAIELSLHLMTYQHSLDDQGEKIFIQVAEDNVTPVTDNELACRRHHVDSIEINVNNYSASDQSAADLRCSNCSKNSDHTPDTLRVNINNGPCAVDFVKLAETTKSRILCHELRQKLVVLLDPVKQISGNDWRAFAEMLGLDACIPKLDTLGNPTENLLNIVESKNMSLTELKRIFQEMNRGDCVQVLQEYIDERDVVSEREPIESSYSGYISQTGTRNISSQMSWDDNTFPGMSTGQSSSASAQIRETDLSQNRQRPSASLGRTDIDGSSINTSSKEMNWRYGRQNLREERPPLQESSYITRGGNSTHAKYLADPNRSQTSRGASDKYGDSRSQYH